jgi:hypothetical protein
MKRILFWICQKVGWSIVQTNELSKLRSYNTDTETALEQLTKIIQLEVAADKNDLKDLGLWRGVPK